MTKPVDPNIGRVLKGTYSVERLIGRGGMGAVYEARHTKISKRYAIKLLLPELGRTDTMRERFFREAEACSRIDHENVVDILDFDETPEGELYMVQALLTGEDLASRLQTGGPREADDIIRWFSEICGALTAAHELGIVHRDLKPANIFLLKRGERELIKVLDFGLAKFRAEAGLTTSGAMMGTPCYMAPEQIEGQGDAVDATTDVFALGCILYELLLGHVAFTGKSLAQIAYQIVHGERPRLPEEPWAPLQPVIDCCLATAPAQRYQTVEDLRVAFVTAMGNIALEDLAGQLPSADPGEQATVSSDPTGATAVASAPTLAVGSAETVAADSGRSATVRLKPRPAPTTTRLKPGPGPGPDTDTDDELPDAALYTTAGRIKQRKWSLAAVLLGTAVLIIGGAFALRALRSDGGSGGKQTAVQKPPPAWAKSLDPELLGRLMKAEDSTHWLTLDLSSWTRLAEGLEKANQPDLGPGKLAALQTRMYLARSRVDLLQGRLAQAQKGSRKALRMATDSGSADALRLAGANAAWIQLHAGNLKAARRGLKRAGGPTRAKLHGLYGAVSLARGEVGMAVSQARKATLATPLDPVGWLVLAAAGDAAGIRLEAERAAARALSLAPDSPLARIQMARKMGTTAQTRKIGSALCTARKTDPPVYRGVLGACRLRLVVRTALARSDNFTSDLVLRRMAKTLGDGPLLTVADLLLAAPGLRRKLTQRILKLARASSTGGHPHAALLGAVAALRLGRIVAAEGLLKTYSAEGRWGYRVLALRAELLLRADRRTEGLKAYQDALHAALRVGVTKKGPKPPKDPVAGACDRQPPQNTDHRILQQRVAILNTLHRPNPRQQDQGLLAVLRVVLRGERVP